MPEIRTTTSPGTRVLDETEAEHEPPYHLFLLDDDSHTYQYVIRMLNDLFGYSPDKGYAIACVVDSAGRAIVMTDGKSRAEEKQDQIHSYGADPLMEVSVGSMSAVVEAAD
jgi:ATP-dependent Clp protease adaptor protein ClpS